MARRKKVPRKSRVRVRLAIRREIRKNGGKDIPVFTKYPGDSISKIYSLNDYRNRMLTIKRESAKIQEALTDLYEKIGETENEDEKDVLEQETEELEDRIEKLTEEFEKIETKEFKLTKTLREEAEYTYFKKRIEEGTAQDRITDMFIDMIAAPLLPLKILGIDYEKIILKVGCFVFIIPFLCFFFLFLSLSGTLTQSSDTSANTTEIMENCEVRSRTQCYRNVTDQNMGSRYTGDGEFPSTL